MLARMRTTQSVFDVLAIKIQMKIIARLKSCRKLYSLPLPKNLEEGDRVPNAVQNHQKKLMMRDRLIRQNHENFQQQFQRGFTIYDYGGSDMPMFRSRHKSAGSRFKVGRREIVAMTRQQNDPRESGAV